MSKLATHVSSHVPVVPSWGGVHMNFPSQELLFPIIPLDCALIQRITCIEQFLNVSWTSEKRKKLWFYLTFLHFLLLVSGPHESETPIHKKCSKVYVQDVFQWKGNKRSDCNPYRTTWSGCGRLGWLFITRPISHRDTRGPPLLWTLSGAVTLIVLPCPNRWSHIINCPILEDGVATLRPGIHLRNAGEFRSTETGSAFPGPSVNYSVGGETGSPHFCEHTGKRIYNFSKLNMKRFKSSFLRIDN